MLLDGEQAGPYHAWQETSPYLKRMLGDAGIFQVDVVTGPPKGGDFTAFKPDWSKYQVVVLNYDAPDERWPDSLKASFEQYVRNGGGLVVYHAADNAFPHWKEFNLMIGVGGWRGRNEQAGPHFYYQDGKPVADTAPGNAGSHGQRLPFLVVNQVTDHPITAGLPKAWMHVADELYANLRGPGQNMTILSTAWSDPANRGTNHDEPMLLVIAYGKGRVFHTTIWPRLVASASSPPSSAGRNGRPPARSRRKCPPTFRRPPRPAPARSTIRQPAGTLRAAGGADLPRRANKRGSDRPDSPRSRRRHAGC
jgi:hypothetical protein